MNTKHLIAALALGTALAAGAQDYNYLTIKYDGRTLSLPLESVDEVRFTSDDLTTGDYTLRVLTFEDADYQGEGNYLGNRDWSSLIDNPQYGGSMLYGDFTKSDYKWYDQNNTELCAAIDPAGEGKVYWDGGEAISNYVNANYATENVDYLQQLAAPAGGYDGSQNFCMHFGNFDGGYYTTPRGGMWFHDGVARTIDHLYVVPAAYTLSVGILGDAYTPRAEADDWVKYVAIGTDAQGNTSETEIYVCQNGVFNTEWQRWDLSVLGDIVRLDFNILSSMVGDWGLQIPAYFAVDNIAVRFPEN